MAKKRIKGATDETWRVAERRRLARFERRLDKLERDILSFMDVLRETAAAVAWSNSAVKQRQWHQIVLCSPGDR